MRNQMGRLIFEEWDLDGVPLQGPIEYPTYTCAHCGKVVVMRPDRLRPRTTCASCGQWICEQSEICASECTPLISLADDGWEASEKWKRFLPAIMHGVGTKAEAAQLGLLI